MTVTILEKIKAYKLEEVAADKAAKPIEAVEAEAKAAGTAVCRTAPALVPPNGYSSSSGVLPPDRISRPQDEHRQR